MKNMVEFRMFGVMEIEADGKLLDPGPPKQRLVLAALLMAAGRPVTLSTLVDRLWNDEPPPGAREIVYAHISRVRRLLEVIDAEQEMPSRLVRSAGGYLLSIVPDVVDVHRFRASVERASQGTLTGESTVAALRRALDLWRGVPLGDIPGDWATRTREGLVRLQISAASRWAELELERNNPKPVIDELYRLVDEHPLQETLAALLVRALHVDGASAEGLLCYARIRQRLADELNTGPGAALRQVAEAIRRPAVSTDVPRVQWRPAC
jgi:DNA-binding SARP family transcriptional activator